MTVKTISVKATSNSASLNDALALLKKVSLYVGIPRGPDREDGDVSNSDIGYLHEHGSSDGKIPARPFLAPSVEGQRKAIEKGMGKAMRAALANDEKGMMVVLEGLGMQTANAVRMYIRDSSNFVPNSPRTIAAKTKDGRVKDKPLIDSGAMMGSVTAIVAKD